MAGLGVVLTVDVNSVCLLTSTLPMMSSIGTYKITYMDRLDLGKIKSGKIFILRWCIHRGRVVTS